MIRIGGDVAQHDGAIDQRRADAFERGEHALPVGLYQIGELAQKEQIAYSAHLLVGPIRFMQAGAQAPVYIARSSRHQPGFHRCFFLQHQLPEACPIIEPCPAENVS